MRREVFVETYLGQKRMAVLEDGVLVEYAVDRPGSERLNGNIYKGVVRDILPGIQASFVNIGLAKNGYLSLEDIAVGKGDMTDSLREQIRSQGAKLRRGQELIVQVVKETSGAKGPRISGNVTIAGALLVYLPTLDYVGVSRKIGDNAERNRLAKIAGKIKPQGSGLIVRTAAAGLPEEALAREAGLLDSLWQRICARAQHAMAPALLFSDSSLECRAVRDLLVPETDAIWFDDRQTYESALEFAAVFSKEGADKLRLYEGGWMFEEKRIDQMANKALERQVALKSGGSIVIDYTEALTAIDVNTGSFVGKNDLEETVFATNCEAAEEIARQLRLRDIGGIVVVDFIDMDEPAHEKAVLEIFARALGADRARTNLGGFTGLGLVELTRHKFHQPVYRLLHEQCAHCGGSGWAPGAETGAREALHKLQARTDRAESSLFLVSASREVMDRMLELGAQYRGNAFIFADKTRSGGQYDISPAAPGDVPRTAVRLGREK
ncbi:MAG: Rne/Rng family ribonuclease [Eubacteriales bacterium]|nr:Rne/Rng family ribonuclease [Eubacteriales bacterium]